MSKIWRWIRSRRRTLVKYEEAKEEFEKIIGRPSIRLVVELPPNLEAVRDEFQELEDDEEFLEALRGFVEGYLKERLSRAPQRPREQRSEGAETSDESV
jgi:hypothetical protein